MAVRMFELPSCTSCRNAAAWLARRGIACEKRHVWNQRPTRQELADIASRHPGGAQALLSCRSIRFKELGLSGRTFTDEALLDLLSEEPRLLRRPIISDGHGVVIGFDRRSLEGMFG